LQGKGLNEAEIQQALNEAAAGGSGTAAAAPAAVSSTPIAPPAYARAAPPPANYGFGQVYAPPPEPPKRDWRDIFVRTACVFT
jgi:peroxin-14